MSKQYLYILIVLSLILLLTGCRETASPQTSSPAETVTIPDTSLPSETIIPPETTPPIEAEASTEPPATMPVETEAVKSTLPYLQRIDRADQSIYDGPGYDYSFAGTVRERGTYTIVEEVWDQEGNLWGKLKSGAGWVDLTEIRSESYISAPISVNYADENLLIHRDYYYCAEPDQEFSISIAFRAYESLRDVALFGFVFSGDQYVPGEEFFTLPEMNEEMPLVADLAFPGDMSMYGIRFTDESGISHVYSIYISGRNGALILEYWES